jgi:antitoxin (DNA-binding transcriptional repressor) of toxin-antitoxin stability system
VIVRTIALADVEFSVLIQAAANGEEVVLSRGGVPVARVWPFPEQLVPQQAMTLKVEMPEDFDEEDPAINTLFGDGDV